MQPAPQDSPLAATQVHFLKQTSPTILIYYIILIIINSIIIILIYYIIKCNIVIECANDSISIHMRKNKQGRSFFSEDKYNLVLLGKNVL